MFTPTSIINSFSAWRSKPERVPGATAENAARPPPAKYEMVLYYKRLKTKSTKHLKPEVISTTFGKNLVTMQYPEFGPDVPKSFCSTSSVVPSITNKAWVGQVEENKMNL